jgi:DNA-directed RNA polymerase specialized sigma24 family protein
LTGMKNIEIAQELNVKEQTVKNQKTAALKVIRNAMSKKGFSAYFNTFPKPLQNLR